jgi:hypothetical protein
LESAYWKGSSNVWGALGNKGPCDAHGSVLEQLSGLTYPEIYDAAISHFFYHTVCHNIYKEQGFFC